MKLSFIVYQLKFYIEMPFCPTPINMFMVAVCYNKYDSYCGYCPLSSVFWKCGLFPATDGCLREHRLNQKGKELIV